MVNALCTNFKYLQLLNYYCNIPTYIMYTIKISNNTECAQEITNIDSDRFKQLLKTKWGEIHAQPDVFRYKVNKMRKRIVNNRYVLLLNPERGSKRREPESIDNIRKPFNENEFNFNKTSSNEHLFTMKEIGNTDTHLFLVNVSPISQYHTLFCPSLNKCLPQVVTEDSIRMVLEVKFLAQDRDLIIVFNSLCAFASVNHLHYHLMYERNILHPALDECINIKGPIYLVNNVVPAFCFEVTKETISQATKDIFRLTEHFVTKSIGHNILVTDRGPLVPGSKDSEVVRVLVTPRLSTAGIKQLTSFNVAALELSGYFPVFNSEYFDEFNAEDLENELRKWRLPNFEELCDEIKALY